MDIDKMKRLVKKMQVQVELTWKREQKMILNEVGDNTKPLKILEIGSGPGAMTEKLCELFPDSKITSLEFDSDFVEYHREYIKNDIKDRVNIIQGDICNIDFESEQYDLVYARLVLQHVHQIDDAIKNISSALKKNGKIIITDVDEGLFGIIDPPIPELEYILGRHIEEQVIEGGDRYIGRKFWKKLKKQNFSNINLELIPVNSDEVGIDLFIPQIDYEEMTTMVDNNLITKENIEDVRAVLDKFLESDSRFVLLVLFFVTAQK